MLFSEDHEVRRVRLNQPHPAQVTPSWHGDAVGRYEGDTLVIDTVGIKADRPFAMIDLFGTPYTDKLHVVERYRLLDHEAVKGDLERGAKENWRPGGPVNPDYKDKYLQVHFTIEDQGAFTTPWTASIDLFARPPRMAGNRLRRKHARIPSRQGCRRPAVRTSRISDPRLVHRGGGVRAIALIMRKLHHAEMASLHRNGDDRRHDRRIEWNMRQVAEL